MLGSDQPTAWLAIWNDERVWIRGSTAESTAADATTASAGLHAIPGATFQRPRLWGQPISDRAADAYTWRHGLFRVGELPESIAPESIAIVFETDWEEMNIFVSYIPKILRTLNA